MCTTANPIKLPTKYTLNGCTLTVSFRNSIEKNDNLEKFYDSSSCGSRYTMTQNYIIPLSIVETGNDQEHILYSCPESAPNCIANIKLFSVKEGAKVCDRADRTSSRFQPLPPNTPSKSQKQDILAKSNECRGTGGTGGTGGNQRACDVFYVGKAFKFKPVGFAYLGTSVEAVVIGIDKSAGMISLRADGRNVESSCEQVISQMK
jgi:hypothetical protein